MFDIVKCNYSPGCDLFYYYYFDIFCLFCNDFVSSKDDGSNVDLGENYLWDFPFAEIWFWW